MKEPSDKSSVSIKNSDSKEISFARGNIFVIVLSKMVHMIALGLPLVIIWLAQPGASKSLWNVNNSDKSYKTTRSLNCTRALRVRLLSLSKT